MAGFADNRSCWSWYQTEGFLRGVGAWGRKSLEVEEMPYAEAGRHDSACAGSWLSPEGEAGQGDQANA